jgi:alpha-beta hydrolase superfamily lysophospholipase
VEPLPDAPGEPVLVVHGLGAGPDLARYGEDTLTGALRAAGFAPFVLAHRADADAIAPSRGVLPTLEGVVEHDLPAALAAVARDTGYDAVHVVGHGLGGVLLAALAGRREGALASVVALGAPLVLPDPPSEARAAALALSLLPGALRLPLRALARGGVPLVDGGTDLFDLAVDCAPSRLRGALAYGVADPPVALVRQVRSWLAAGTPTLHRGAVEVRDLVRDAEVPLLVVTAEDDPTCPPAAGEAALGTWGHPDAEALRVPGSHLDLLLGREAPERVFAPVVAWLDARRRRAWTPAGALSAG